MKTYRINIVIRVLIIFLSFLLLLLNGLMAQTSIATGNWTNTSTWGGGAPNNTMNSGSAVVISVGDVVTLNSSLDVKSNASLDVYGELIVNNSIVFWNGCNVTIHEGGVLTCNSGVTNNNASGITINGSLVCYGDYTAGTGSTIGGDGTCQVQGTLTVSGSATVMGVPSPGCTSCNVSASSGITNAGIYSEDFSTNDGKGYGNMSGVTNWEVDGTGTPSGYFRVSGGKFSSNNLDKTMNWYSKTVSGSYTDISIELTAGVTYGYSGEGINFYYQIDGGAWVSFGSFIQYTGYSSNGGVWNGNTLTISGLSCTSSIKVKLSYYSTHSYSDYYHDNVIMYGIPAVNTWTGAVSDDWSNVSNWSLGVLPGSSHRPSISLKPHQPKISSNVSLDGVTINSGVTLTVRSNAVLTLSGNMSNNGSLIIDNATVSVNGDFDATNGVVDFTSSNGVLNLNSTVTSLGTLDETMGTVTYGGSSQTVLSDTYYNLSIENAGIKSVSNNVKVNGDLTTSNTANCVLDMGPYTLELLGDLNVGALNGLDLSDASSNVLLSGVSNQIITHAGSSSFDVNNLTINKTGGLVQLNSPITVDGLVTFTSGDIDASTNDLNLTSNASVTGASSNSHVIGWVNKTSATTNSFEFPVGDGVTYRPIKMIPNSTSNTLWSAKYTPSSYPVLDRDGSGLDSVSTQEYWDLDRIGLADAVVELTWGIDQSVANYAELVIAHFDGVDWDMIPSSVTGSNSSGSVRSTGPVTTFSPFTIGTTQTASPLPVGLIGFNVQKKSHLNEINWEVATEKDVLYYVVERTVDGQYFENINQKNTSFSFDKKAYSYLDNSFENTINYYRIKFVDTDGNEHFTNIQSVDNRMVDRVLINVTNALGQAVNYINPNQLYIYQYSDGTSEKKIVVVQ